MKAAVKLGDAQLQTQVQLIELIAKCLPVFAHANTALMTPDVVKLADHIPTFLSLFKHVAELEQVVAVRTGVMRCMIVLEA